MNAFKARIYGGRKLNRNQRLWHVEIWDITNHCCVVTDNTGSWERMRDYGREGCIALRRASTWGLYKPPKGRDRWARGRGCPCHQCRESPASDAEGWSA